MFHGLFVGIDRFSSPDISELSFAERDARALHSLFHDNLGEGGELLTGAAAIRSAIEQRFEELSQCDPEDVVVIAFSGHGSETHELVTHDADLRDLNGSCIPLDLLTHWFARIPAKHLVCVLDCCFSGAMGTKVLKVDSKPRSLRSVEAELQELAGEGRLILTASTATQPAWENARLRHGLLTYHLLEALRGPAEIRRANRLPIYQVLDWITRRVIDAADDLGVIQQPTLRGTLDGELTWPVFSPGSLYSASFPDLASSPVTAALDSLGGRGFPTEVITAWGDEIPELNALQIEAINDYGVLDGDSLLVVAPTSSGKTMVGELGALKGVLERRRALFLLPLKALVNDKYEEFQRKYGPLGIRTIRATGDFNDEVGALMRGRYDICLMTYEKCAALVLGASHILDGVGTIVVDEVQTIVDRSRGVNLEFLLTLLRVRRRRGAATQLIALSAVIGDSGELERWLGARLLRREQRPVPLDEGLLTQDGAFRFVSEEDGQEHRESFIRPVVGGGNRGWVIPLVERLVYDGEQVIVFRETKGETVGCASYLANSLGLQPAENTLTNLPTGDLAVASQRLRHTLAGGVGFHNADLDRAERLALEGGFRSGDVRVLVATTTLAMGVNTPASSVVIVGLNHPNGPYSVAEYRNMTGRAGRLGFSERGRSFIIAPDFRSEHHSWTGYVHGRAEDLRSLFLDADHRALVLRVLATSAQVARGTRMTRQDVVSFLEDSFGAYQRRRSADVWKWDGRQLEEAVSELERHDLISADEQGLLELTRLGRLAGESGIAIASVLRLVAGVRGLHRAQFDAVGVLSLVQVTEELDEVFMPLNTRGFRKEGASWFGLLAQRGLPASLGTLLRVGVQSDLAAIRRAKRATACLLWMDGHERQEIERTLMRHHRDNAAAGPVQQAVGRTLDLLPIAVGIAELVYEEDLSGFHEDMTLRLTFGIPDEVGELARALGSELTRADYLSLLRSGIASLEQISAVSDQKLGAALGGDDKKMRRVREVVRNAA